MHPRHSVRARELAGPYRELKDDLGLDHFEGRIYALDASRCARRRRLHLLTDQTRMLPIVRGWVHEVLDQLYILHNRWLKVVQTQGHAG